VYHGTIRHRIARLNSDDGLDLSFDPGTGPNDAVSVMVLQSGGQILIGGQFTSLNGLSWNGFARLRVDGSVDTGFDMNPTHGLGPNASVSAIAVQGDGRILIGGPFVQVNGTTSSNLARLITNGALDASFSAGTGLSGSVGDYPDALGIQSDGSIIVGGPFSSIDGVPRSALSCSHATNLKTDAVEVIGSLRKTRSATTSAPG
jgi:hypothetical protein